MSKSKSKSLSLLGIALIIGSMCNAQIIAPQSVNSSGSKMTQSNGSLSFTVGELVVLSQIDIQGNSIGSGFTASAALAIVSVQETNTSVLDVNVYPNPTSDMIHIQINHSTLEQVVVTINDLQGKDIYIGKYACISNVIGINTTSYSKGIYMLTFRSLNNETLGKYKFIKN